LFLVPGLTRRWFRRTIPRSFSFSKFTFGKGGAGMGKFCVVVDGTEPDGGDLQARHEEATLLLSQFTARLRALGMGVTFAALMTPYDGSDETGDVRVEEAAQPGDQARAVPRRPPLAAAPEPPTGYPADIEAPVDPADGGQPDNALPLKCPGCGRTYPDGDYCAAGHPPIALLPTDEVLAGVEAPSTDAEQAPAETPAEPAAEATDEPDFPTA
jgi:hypothetical protein